MGSKNFIASRYSAPAGNLGMGKMIAVWTAGRTHGVSGSAVDGYSAEIDVLGSAVGHAG